MEQLQENGIKVLAQIRPAFQRDGGDAEFIGIGRNQVVQTRMTGDSQSRPISPVTLKES